MWQAWNANRNFVVFLKTKIYNRRKVLIYNFHKKLFKVIREKATSICKLRFVDQIRALKRLDEFPTRFSDVLLNKIEKNFFFEKTSNNTYHIYILFVYSIFQHYVTSFYDYSVKTFDLFYQQYRHNWLKKVWLLTFKNPWSSGPPHSWTLF